jgi:hypothetical protein
MLITLLLSFVRTFYVFERICSGINEFCMSNWKKFMCLVAYLIIVVLDLRFKPEMVTRI